MLDLALTDGPGRPLVRGFATCLASVTEVDPASLLPAEEMTLPHALGAWRGWLAGRGSGLVPIAEPRSFQWAGWWIAVIDGGNEQAAVLVFGTPPGIVLSPQDPALLGRATADLPIGSAYAVASLDPVLRPLPAATRLAGVVEQIALAPAVEAEMELVDSVRALAGRGLEGDRYAYGAGTFSSRAGHKPGFELTLIAAEVVEGLTARDAALDFRSTRRNLLTRGIDVNALVGREFRVGGVTCLGRRLAEPCAQLERLAGPGLLRPLIHRGGLRADVLTDGDVHRGDAVTASP